MQIGPSGLFSAETSGEEELKRNLPVNRKRRHDEIENKNGELLEKVEEQQKRMATEPASEEVFDFKEVKDWSSERENLRQNLTQILPHMQAMSDPFKMCNVVVPKPNGEAMQFPIRQNALIKVSDVYKNALNGSWKEESPIWVEKNFEGKPIYYYDIRAAAHVIAFAYKKSGDILPDHYQTLKQFLNKLLASNEEKQQIFQDVLKLSHCYDIKGLKKECEEFILDQMSQSSQHIVDHFHIILEQPADLELGSIWITGCVELASKDEHREEMLELISSLLDEDYSSYPNERQNAIRIIFKKCLAEIFLNLKLEKNNLEQLEKICCLLIKAYPLLDFPHALAQKLSLVFRNFLSILPSISCILSMYCNAFILFELQRSGISKFIAKDENIYKKLHTLYLMIEAKNLNKSLEDFDAALKLNAYVPLVLYHRGKYYNQNPDQLHLALGDLNEALKCDPTNAHVLAIRGNIYRRQNLLDLALNDLNEALKLVPNYELALTIRADCHRLKNNFELALADLEKVKNDPDKSIKSFIPCIKAILGNCFFKQGKLDLAIVCLNNGNPNDPLTKETMQKCHDELRSMKMDELDTFIKLYPNNMHALVIRGMRHYTLGNKDLAIENFNTAETKNKINPVTQVFALELRGDFYFQQGNIKMAFKDINQVLEYCPDSVPALAIRGECYRKKSKYTQAIKDLNFALAKKPDYHFARASLGACHFKLGNIPAAKTELQTVLKDEPENLLAKRMMNQINKMEKNPSIQTKPTKKTR